MPAVRAGHDLLETEHVFGPGGGHDFSRSRLGPDRRLQMPGLWKTGIFPGRLFILSGGASSRGGGAGSCGYRRILYAWLWTRCQVPCLRERAPGGRPFLPAVRNAAGPALRVVRKMVSGIGGGLPPLREQKKEINAKAAASAAVLFARMRYGAAAGCSVIFDRICYRNFYILFRLFSSCFVYNNSK